MQITQATASSPSAPSLPHTTKPVHSAPEPFAL